MKKVVNGIEIELSVEEIQAITTEWAANELSSKRTEYIRKRQLEYPSIGDQLDALYKSFKELSKTMVLPATTLEWIQNIDNIKNKYPKPVSEGTQ